MAKLKQESEPLWPNLRYATLADVRKELPGTISAWAIVSAFTVGIGWLLQFVPSISGATSGTTWESPLPHWANYTIVASILLWLVRGHEFHFRMPRMSFGAWVGLCIYFAALFFVVSSFPWWVFLPTLWANTLFFSLLETLDAQGKENCEVFEAARA